LFVFLGRKKKKKIPEELHDQWERDRVKKAERKHLRELERIAATVDPFTTRKGKGGKKARKAKLAATVARSMSLETIVGHMRRFIADIGGARTLPFPPMNPKMRKSVHELAHAFKLESKSRGKGAERCTTLMKKTLSGVNVDEKKIAQILGKSSSFPTYTKHEGGGGKGKGELKTRPRDGDVVGEVRFSMPSQ
jgi:R3H domain